jgi:chaperonin GroEL (HSP60 family)
MSVSTLENLLKVMREKLSQQDINRAMLLAVDEIIRELKRLDTETRKAKRAINRRFLNL